MLMRPKDPEAYREWIEDLLMPMAISGCFLIFLALAGVILQALFVHGPPGVARQVLLVNEPTTPLRRWLALVFAGGGLVGMAIWAVRTAVWGDPDGGRRTWIFGLLCTPAILLALIIAFAVGGSIAHGIPPLEQLTQEPTDVSGLIVILQLGSAIVLAIGSLALLRRLLSIELPGPPREVSDKERADAWPLRALTYVAVHPIWSLILALGGSLLSVTILSHTANLPSWVHLVVFWGAFYGLEAHAAPYLGGRYNLRGLPWLFNDLQAKSSETPSPNG